jgi:isoaspartyl peptidase/L-asparaginase-like protein (Ntn-hydrolase superfamily)
VRFGCQEEPYVPQLLVVHGGVDMDSGDASIATLTRAAVAGWRNIAPEHGPDAVVDAIAVLEDDPAFTVAEAGAAYLRLLGTRDINLRSGDILGGDREA